MKKARSITNIDMLRLRCTGGDIMLEYLLEFREYCFADGKVIANKFETFKCKDEVKKVNADVYMNGLDYPIAELAIERNHYTHLRINNRYFYEKKGLFEGTIFGLLECLFLSLDAIERVDVCVDSNVSLLARTRKMIKNTSQFDMLINGNKVKEDEACLLLVSQLSRRKILGNGAVVKKNTSGLELKLYDKLSEIKEQSDKQYILQHNQMTGEKVVHRLEVVITEKYINSHYDNVEDFLRLCCCGQRPQLIRELSNRIIRFNSKKASRLRMADTISLLDLIY